MPILLIGRCFVASTCRRTCLQFMPSVQCTEIEAVTADVTCALHCDGQQSLSGVARELCERPSAPYHAVSFNQGLMEWQYD